MAKKQQATVTARTGGAYTAASVNWLSTKWPLHVEVIGRSADETVVIEVLAGASSSVGGKREVERKLGEFVELIKTHSGAAGETSAT